MSLYLDASVLLPVFNPELASDSVDRFLDQTRDVLLISEFANAEVASAFSRLVRAGVLDEADAKERLSDFDVWRTAKTEVIEVESADVRSAGMIVRRFDLMLRTPDAIHLAICRRKGAQMVTLDRGLATASAALDVSVAIIPTG